MNFDQTQNNAAKNNHLELAKMQISSKFITEIDVYRGLHIKVEQRIEIQEFTKYVEGQEGSAQNFKAIWIYFKTNNLAVLDVLVNGHKYLIHHGLGNDIVIYKWLRKQQDHTVPYSMFWIAAGALVIKDNKVLLVQQKSGKRKGKYGLPGGRANRGEMIAQCAERQLRQQTGIRAKFQRIVYFRQLTVGQLYNCVDLYYICLMSLDEESFAEFKLCQRQINNFKWVDLVQYEQFCIKNSIGSQLLVSKHISKLFRENRLFSNISYQKNLNLQKGLCEHRL